MSLQELCEQGQQQLMSMEYLRAEKTLIEAEQRATSAGDFDTLARLYMPLQEARRQRRQRCGEGIVRLDLVATGPEDSFDPSQILDQYPHGQLLIAGWGTIEPALALRQLADDTQKYVETFLGAVFPAGGGRVVVVVPLPDVKLPEPTPRAIDELLKLLPAHSIVLDLKELVPGERNGNTATFAEVMSMWERLHAPFLAAADRAAGPAQKIEGYRKTISVDYACELAHQRLSNTGRQLAKKSR